LDIAGRLLCRPAPPPVRRSASRRFYGRIALLITAIVFAGFSRSFYRSPCLDGPAPSPLRIVP
jgi:hypothetical protein